MENGPVQYRSTIFWLISVQKSVKVANLDTNLCWRVSVVKVVYRVYKTCLKKRDLEKVTRNKIVTIVVESLSRMHVPLNYCNCCHQKKSEIGQCSIIILQVVTLNFSIFQIVFYILVLYQKVFVIRINHYLSSTCLWEME